jgi:hypothetical protein
MTDAKNLPAIRSQNALVTTIEKAEAAEKRSDKIMARGLGTIILGACATVTGVILCPPLAVGGMAILIGGVTASTYGITSGVGAIRRKIKAQNAHNEILHKAVLSVVASPQREKKTWQVGQELPVTVPGENPKLLCIEKVAAEQILSHTNQQTALQTVICAKLYEAMLEADGSLTRGEVTAGISDFTYVMAGESRALTPVAPKSKAGTEDVTTVLVLSAPAQLSATAPVRPPTGLSWSPKIN